jgi:hypothetical protein
MIKKRNIAVCIILSIVTCGLYGIYWWITITDDVVTANKGKEYSTSGGVAFLLTLITCGIYGIYWYYKMGKALYIAKTDKGMPATDNSLLYLLLGIFGLGIISECLMTDELNKIADANE